MWMPGVTVAYWGRGVAMGGIQFLTDEKGQKTAAVLDLKVHKALWEDIQDVLVSRSRRQGEGRAAGEGQGWVDCDREAA
jgi:hypothetical protein